MTTDTLSIENLTKVSLTIKNDDHAAGIPFEFIYGVGPEGITPFEKALFGKGVGDAVRFDTLSSGYRETMGHLELPLLKQTGMLQPASLQVTVDAVAKATDQEVVKAMAAGGSCNDCGCGCGGH